MLAKTFPLRTKRNNQIVDNTIYIYRLSKCHDQKLSLVANSQYTQYIYLEKILENQRRIDMIGQFLKSSNGDFIWNQVSPLSAPAAN